MTSLAPVITPTPPLYPLPNETPESVALTIYAWCKLRHLANALNQPRIKPRTVYHCWYHIVPDGKNTYVIAETTARGLGLGTVAFLDRYDAEEAAKKMTLEELAALHVAGTPAAYGAVNSTIFTP